MDFDFDDLNWKKIISYILYATISAFIFKGCNGFISSFFIHSTNAISHEVINKSTESSSTSIESLKKEQENLKSEIEALKKEAKTKSNIASNTSNNRKSSNRYNNSSANKLSTDASGNSSENKFTHVRTPFRIENSGRQLKLAQRERVINNLKDNSKFLRVKLKNTSTNTIKVAVKYRDLQNQWIIEGWWIVNPYSECLTNMKTTNGIMYYYAESTNKQKRWSGDQYLKIPEQSFILLPDDRIIGSGGTMDAGFSAHSSGATSLGGTIVMIF